MLRELCQAKTRGVAQLLPSPLRRRADEEGTHLHVQRGRPQSQLRTPSPPLAVRGTVVSHTDDLQLCACWCHPVAGILKLPETIFLVSAVSRQSEVKRMSSGQGLLSHQRLALSSALPTGQREAESCHIPSLLTLLLC